MSLVIISIPLMLVAIGIAVVPLIAMSKKELRHLMQEAERRVEEHRLVHQARSHSETASAPAPAPVDGAGHAPDHRVRTGRRHEPVLVESA